MKVLVFILFILISSVTAQADKDRIEIGIDEKLGSYIPQETFFFDEHGDSIKLGDLINKPTILALVYFDCPGVCHPLLNGVSELVDRIDMKPGEEFNLLTISFDHNEIPATARKWKNEHLVSLKRKIPEDSWRFLTGDSVNIRKLTNAVGFYFKRDKDGTFLHSGALITLSQNGMISRYIFGMSFLPFDVKLALIEAQKGEFRPTINKILAFCYNYDREGNKYVFNVTKVFGSIMFIFVAVLFITLTIRGKVKKGKEKRE